MLVRTHTEDEYPTNIPFTVCLVREGRITLRLANIDERDVYVCKGAQLDIASTNASVLANRKQENGDKSVSHREATIGGNLDRIQSQELFRLLAQHDYIYYKGVNSFW